jgi:hypothetical protein
MTRFTASSIEKQLSEVARRLSSYPKEAPIYLSIGENCGPAIKLRQAGLSALGSGFFDNLVIPIESTIRLLDEDFSRILTLRNLSIGMWEGNDSVFDKSHNIFFHHYFHKHGEEKTISRDGRLHRRIDEEDIPLFLPSVMAQFEYLAEKMRMILRSPHRKFLVVRRVNGAPIQRQVTGRLGETLSRLGAMDTAVAVVHSRPIAPECGDVDSAIHRFIPEHGERWGDRLAWVAAFQD